MDDHTAMIKYVAMTVIFGLLLLLAGALGPIVSLKNSKRIGELLQPALAYAELGWFERTGTTKAATRLGKVK